MKKSVCLIALVLVLSMNAPLTFAQTSPITVGGGGAQVQSLPKPSDNSQSFATTLTVEVITMIINAGII